MISKRFVYLYDYVRWYASAKTRHGIHSPFVYSLTDKAIRRDSDEIVHLKIEQRRQALLADHHVIRVQDFGAGFGGQKFNERKVSYITRHSAKPKRYARLLFRLVQHFKPATILELGTSAGISALYMATANPNASVVTIEGCPQTASLASESFKQFDKLNINLKVGSFDEVLQDVLHQLPQPTFDFIFIDGHHQYESTIRYYHLLKNHIHQHSVMVFDDIYWSAEMKEAWKALQDMPEVRISVDLFQFGLLFFDAGLSREKFSIRF